MFAAQNSSKWFYDSSINGFNLQVLVLNILFAACLSLFLNASAMKSNVNIVLLYCITLIYILNNSHKMLNL